MFYSVVQIVSPGAICSYPAGKWEVGFSDTESEAYQTCARFNACRFAPDIGIVYDVECLESDESPDRAKTN